MPVVFALASSVTGMLVAAEAARPRHEDPRRQGDDEDEEDEAGDLHGGFSEAAGANYHDGALRAASIVVRSRRIANGAIVPVPSCSGKEGSTCVGSPLSRPWQRSPASSAWLRF